MASSSAGQTSASSVRGDPHGQGVPVQVHVTRTDGEGVCAAAVVAENVKAATTSANNPYALLLSFSIAVRECAHGVPGSGGDESRIVNELQGHARARSSALAAG
jgi:hypothetical protein